MNTNENDNARKQPQDSPEPHTSDWPLLGTRIDHYRVIDFIGKGGMGEVYVAYDEKLQRKVALKAIRGEKRFDKEAKARLLREAQLLSQLDHPNICRIYSILETTDADVLVLELIAGTALQETRISDLSQSEKLEIAVQIGEVLADAHAHGVVHRDLKPENIMITDHGDIKVLDFGLAFSLANRDVTLTLPRAPSSDPRSGGVQPTSGVAAGYETEQGSIMGTPLYMSPEQAAGKTVTAASDMYSFGLLLQWLFTGSRPFPEGLSPEQTLARAIKGETLPPEGVTEDLRKLLERLKALDPTSRPCAVDVVERLRWILEMPKRRRRKLAVAGVIAALTLGIIISLLSLLSARRSERQERIARARQEKLSAFLVDMWTSPSPMERGRDLKVVDLLSSWEEQLEGAFQDDPPIKAMLLNHLGTTYRRLGEYAKAETIMTDCLDYCRANLEPDHTRTITVMIDLAILLSYDERLPEAEDLLREALTLGQDNLQPDHELIIYAKEQLADVLIARAEHTEAQALLQEVLSVIRDNEALHYKFGPKVLLNLGNILLFGEDFRAAEKIFLELLRDYEEKGDTSNPNYIAAKGSVARAFMELHKFEDGLRHMREGLEMSQRVNGERHRTTLVLEVNLGMALSALGRHEESLLHTEFAFEAFEEVFGERAPATVFVSVNYANQLRELGRFSEAETYLKKAVALNGETLGAEHPNTLRSQLALSHLYFDSNRGSEAEGMTRRVLEASQDTLGEDKELTLEGKDLLGRILKQKGKPAQAERIHREVLGSKLAAVDDKDVFAGDTLQYLSESLLLQEKKAEACRYIEQSVRSWHENWGGDHPRTKEAAGLLVEIFRASNRAQEADSILESIGLTTG